MSAPRVLRYHLRFPRAAEHIADVRLELELSQGVHLVTGKRWKAKESLEPGQETLRGTWLLRGPPGARVTVRVTSEQAGGASKTLRLEQE